MKRGYKVAIGVATAIATALGIGYLLTRKPLPPLPPEQIFLTDLVISPALIYPGDTVYIQVMATNIGGQAGSATITMEVFGMIYTKTVTLNPGESKAVSFQITAPGVGTWGVSVDGLQGSFTVLQPPQAKFLIRDLVISPTQVYPGEVVNISVTVSNIGEAAGSYTVTCEVL